LTARRLACVFAGAFFADAFFADAFFAGAFFAGAFVVDAFFVAAFFAEGFAAAFADALFFDVLLFFDEAVVVRDDLRAAGVVPPAALRVTVDVTFFAVAGATLVAVERAMNARPPLSLVVQLPPHACGEDMPYLPLHQLTPSAETPTFGRKT